MPPMAHMPLICAGSGIFAVVKRGRDAGQTDNMKYVRISYVRTDDEGSHAHQFALFAMIA